MYQDLLKNSGLSEKEAATYEKLLEIGAASVGKLLKVLPYKRGDMYNIVQSLCDKGLCPEELKSGVLTYTLESPEKLTALLQAEQEKTKNALREAATVLPHLQSLYNLSLNRPGVRFFEGMSGVQKALEDTLTSRTEIYSYGDIDSITQYIPDINTAYVKKRERKNIKKRGIALDTPTARTYLAGYYKTITETKLIAPHNAQLFGCIMNIYDDKISYITLGEDSKIGVIIHDPLIYKMHKTLFEHLWDITPGLVI